MEQNEFYYILGSRGNGRTESQCDYIERAYEKMRKEKQATRDLVGKIIDVYDEEIQRLINIYARRVRFLKRFSPQSKKEAIIRNEQMLVNNLCVAEMGYMKQCINKKVEDIIKDYGKEN